MDRSVNRCRIGSQRTLQTNNRVPGVPIADLGGSQVEDVGCDSHVIVSVTTLGAKAGAVGRAADHVVGYLEGNQSAERQRASDSPSRAGSAAPGVA